MSGGCDRERTDEEREIETLRSEVRTLRWEVRGARERADVAERTLAERTAERDAISAAVEEAGIGTRGPDDTLLARVHRLIADANEVEQQRDTLARAIELRDDESLADRVALAATVEKLIREAGAVRADERQRAKADEDALVSRAHQRAINRVAELEEQLAKARTLVDHADRVKEENEALRGQVRTLTKRHDEGTTT